MRKPIELPKELEQRVVELREKGLSYRAIIETIANPLVTERITKRLCKGVVMGNNTNEYKAVDQILKLSLRPQGVKPSEINDIHYAVYGTIFDEKKSKHILNMNQKEKASIKRKVVAKAKSLNVRPLFVPEWMQLKHIKESKRLVFEKAQELHTLLFDISNDYNCSFPNATSWETSSFVYEVCALNIAKLAPLGVHKTFDNMLDKLHLLETQVEQEEPSEIIKYEPNMFTIDEGGLL